MSAAKKLREDLHHYIEELDEKFLKVVHAMVEAYADQEQVLGSTPDGKPITKNELIQRAKLAEEDIKEGRVVDIEDMEKEEW